MADSADDGNATWSRRLKGQAIKAWQFLIPKKRNRQVLSSDDESSINNQVSIRLSPSAQNFIIPFKPKGPATKTKNKILLKILPKKKSTKEQSTNDKESISEVRDTYPMYITNVLMIRPPSSPPTLQFKKNCCVVIPHASLQLSRFQMMTRIVRGLRVTRPLRMPSLPSPSSVKCPLFSIQRLLITI